MEAELRTALEVSLDAKLAAKAGEHAEQMTRWEQREAASQQQIAGLRAEAEELRAKGRGLVSQKDALAKAEAENRTTAAAAEALRLEAEGLRQAALQRDQDHCMAVSQLQSELEQKVVCEAEAGRAAVQAVGAELATKEAEVAALVRAKAAQELEVAASRQRQKELEAEVEELTSTHLELVSGNATHDTLVEVELRTTKETVAGLRRDALSHEQEHLTVVSKLRSELTLAKGESKRQAASGVARESEHAFLVSELQAECARQLGRTECEWAEKLAANQLDATSALQAERAHASKLQSHQEAEIAQLLGAKEKQKQRVQGLRADQAALEVSLDAKLAAKAGEHAEQMTRWEQREAASQQQIAGLRAEAEELRAKGRGLVSQKDALAKAEAENRTTAAAAEALRLEAEGLRQAALQRDQDHCMAVSQLQSELEQMLACKEDERTQKAWMLEDSCDAQDDDEAHQLQRRIRGLQEAGQQLSQALAAYPPSLAEARRLLWEEHRALEQLYHDVLILGRNGRASELRQIATDEHLPLQSSTGMEPDLSLHRAVIVLLLLLQMFMTAWVTRGAGVLDWLRSILFPCRCGNPELCDLSLPENSFCHSLPY